MLKFINDYLIVNNICKTEYKINKRHEGRDGYKFGLRITGNNIVEKIIRLIYPNDEISLNRKYEIANNIKSYMDEYRRESCNV